MQARLALVVVACFVGVLMYKCLCFPHEGNVSPYERDRGKGRLVGAALWLGLGAEGSG